MFSAYYDVIIIGGGPAGLTAGLYTARARLKALLIDNLGIGGQAIVTDVIENYPGFPEGIKGIDLITKIKKQAEAFGLEFESGEVEGIARVIQNTNLWNLKLENKIYKSLAVIVATGARPRKLGVKGEDEFLGKGISYCATCDGAFFKDKNIVVVGGGDTAVEEALFLTKFASKVTLIHRRERLRAIKILQERVKASEKIEFVLDSQIVNISGDRNVEMVRVKNIKSQEETNIYCQGVFIFVGLMPNTDFLKGIIKLDEKGYIITDENMMTSENGIFACGDCRKKILRQIVTACSDGAISAFSARQYVEGLKEKHE